MSSQQDKQELFDALAALYEYPNQGIYFERLSAFLKQIGEAYPGCVKELSLLAEQTEGKANGEVEEMFTRTFDINAICCLEIGWHIYGEEYARGSLMVRFREELRARDIPESQELPDHLTHVLQLIGRLEGEMADDLAGRYVLPALEKMLSGLEGKQSPYEGLLAATGKIIRLEHPDAKLITPQARRPQAPDSKTRLPLYGPQAEQGGGCAGMRG